MRYSELLLPTLKENPADAEVVSHRLLLRAGFIRKLTSGVYSYLPLGLAAIRKVEQIVREEMNRAGAQELLLPMVQPGELWQESGRWAKYGAELLRFTDRHNRESCLGPTHEEVITDLVRMNVHSYRDLPKNLYQIQTKFRDEVRPRFGLMRGREFIMKDGYSFAADEAGAEEIYRKMYDAYQRIFTRCGLEFRAVEADTGSIGGSFSHEFMVLAETGEDTVVACRGCDYAANLEKAAGVEPEKSADTPLAVEKVATPGKKKVEEVCAFLGIPEEKLAKTMVYIADEKPLAVMVRGDHEVQEVKLTNLVGAIDLRLATDAEITDATGAPCGFLGPLGLGLPLYVDREVMVMANIVTGANEADTHLANVNPGRDFTPEMVGDIRTVTSADRCPRCGGEFDFVKGIEVGHIFKLGTSYSEAMGAKFLDRNGKEQFFVMGCYGIGVSRIVAAAIEQNHDDDGIIFPLPLAPCKVALLNLAMKDEEVGRACEKLYDELQAAGIEVLYDDRNERPGIKFKDADLLGLPYRLVLGKKFLDTGEIDVRTRRGETFLLAGDEAAKIISERVAGELAALL